jgi:hypothetical protein
VARRDNVQAGIHGNSTDGGFSIIDGYDGADNNQGDVLWYSGSMAMTRGPQYLVKRTYLRHCTSHYEAHRKTPRTFHPQTRCRKPLVDNMSEPPKHPNFEGTLARHLSRKTTKQPRGDPEPTIAAGHWTTAYALNHGLLMPTHSASHSTNLFSQPRPPVCWRDVCAYEQLLK